MNIQERLDAAIPGGAHTYSRGKDQFPSNAPAALVSAKGSHVRDSSDSEFLDYGMALRSVTLGYSNPEVNEAAFDAINLGNNLTKPSMVELDAAEKFISLVPSVEMVKFAKNGSNVTTAAVKVARAVTDKKYVCVPRQQPFFSFDDWFIGTTPIKKGIPNEHMSTTLLFDYGDLNSLLSLFETYENQIAAVMLEPVTVTSPCSKHKIEEFSAETKCNEIICQDSNFLYQVQKLCKSNQVLFILDEMISGFRWTTTGAQSYFNLDPDLTTFGKAMANGFSVAALGGKREFMSVGSVNKIGDERTFLLSSTHGAEMSSLAAFLKVAEIYERDSVANQLWNIGSELRTILDRNILASGLNESIKVTGPSIGLALQFSDTSLCTGPELRTLFMQEMIKHKIIMPWIAQSISHDKQDLDKTETASLEAFKVLREAVEKGASSLLEGPVAKPVFRRFN